MVHDGPLPPSPTRKKLPQFTEPEAIDINKHFMLDKLGDKDHWEVEFESHPDDQGPEELDIRL